MSLSSDRVSLPKISKSFYFEGSITFFSSENENPQTFPQNYLFFPHFPRASLLPSASLFLPTLRQEKNYITRALARDRGTELIPTEGRFSVSVTAVGFSSCH